MKHKKLLVSQKRGTPGFSMNGWTGYTAISDGRGRSHLRRKVISRLPHLRRNQSERTFAVFLTRWPHVSLQL